MPPTSSPQPIPQGACAPRAQGTLAFVALIASLGALNAFSTDIVIPALGLIARDLDLADPNRRQWVVFAVLAGMAGSQLLLGPVADSLGRRRAAFLGFAIFIAGGALSASAQSFETLIAGRLLQGFGSGGLRVVGLAITRDRFSGDAMARIVSLTTAAFVLMVFAAPLLGQLVVAVAGWRWVFGVLIAQCLATAAWMALAQPETLRPEHRRAFSLRAMIATLAESLRHPATLGYALALGGAFGAFALYLGSAQQIFGDIYRLGALLPIAFGGLSLTYGAVSLANAWLVMRFGAIRVVRAGMQIWTLASILGAAVFALAFDGVPPLWLYMGVMAIPISCFALLYGNMSALALAPMGNKAGSASSILAAIGTLIGVVIAGIGGAALENTVTPVMIVFALTGVSGVLILERMRRLGRG